MKIFCIREKYCHSLECSLSKFKVSQSAYSFPFIKTDLMDQHEPIRNALNYVKRKDLFSNISLYKSTFLLSLHLDEAVKYVYERTIH